MKKLLLLIIITGISLITTQKGLAEEDPWQNYVEKETKDFLYWSSPENLANSKRFKVYDGFLQNISQKDYEDFIFLTNRLHAQCFNAEISDIKNVGAWQKLSRDIYRKVAKKLNWSETRLSSVENNSVLLNKAIVFIKLQCPNGISSLILKFRTPFMFTKSIKDFEKLEKDFSRQYELKFYTATESEKANLIEKYGENYTRYLNLNSPTNAWLTDREIQKDLESCQNLPEKIPSSDVDALVKNMKLSSQKFMCEKLMRDTKYR